MTPRILFAFLLLLSSAVRASVQLRQPAERVDQALLAGRLKSGFAQIYVMFGDFGGS